MLSFFLALGLLLPTSAPPAKPTLLTATRWVGLHRLPEPSDAVLAPDGRSFYIVSDEGLLFQTDLEGHVLRQAPPDPAATDFEAITFDSTGHHLLVMDEGTRRLISFDPATDLQRGPAHEVPWGGGRNKGIEALTWNPVRHRYLCATERDPARLIELDADFRKTTEWPWPHTSDVSALTFHHDALWLLADEARELLRLDPRTYAVTGRWRLPVLNPEGLAFLPDGQLVILSDDLARLYYFPAPSVL